MEENKKVLFVCGWCLTKEDYTDYPEDWEYYSYVDLSLECAVTEVAKKIKSGVYTDVMAHSLGCAVVHRTHSYTRVRVTYICPRISQLPRLSPLYRLYWLCPMFIYKFFEHRMGNWNISACKALLDGRYPTIEQLISASSVKGKLVGKCDVIACRKDIIRKCYIEGATVREVDDYHLPTWQSIGGIL